MNFVNRVRTIKDKVRFWCDRTGFFTMMGLLMVTWLILGQTGLIITPPVVSAQESITLEETIDIGVDRLSFDRDWSRLFNYHQDNEPFICTYNPGLFSSDQGWWTQDGLASWELETDPAQLTIRLKPHQFWSDGEPITIDDVILPYYVLADPSYRGNYPRYMIDHVQGVVAYRAGEVGSISGLERLDSLTLRVHYDSYWPNFPLEGGGILNLIEPSHLLAGLSVSEMESEIRSWSAPVSCGQLEVERHIPNRQLKFIPRQDQAWSRHVLEALSLNVRYVATEDLINLLASGDIDRAALLYESVLAYSAGESLEMLGLEAHASSLEMGLLMNPYRWSADEGSVLADSLLLRQVLAQALDPVELRRALDLAPPQLGPGESQPSITDLEEKLLEAGWVDQDGDGYLETPDGQSVKINLAASSYSQQTDYLVTYILERWRLLGIDARLYQDQLLDDQDFRQELNRPNSGIDYLLIPLNPQQVLDNEASSISPVGHYRLRAFSDLLSLPALLICQTDDWPDDPQERAQAWLQAIETELDEQARWTRLYPIVSVDSKSTVTRSYALD